LAQADRTAPSYGIAFLVLLVTVSKAIPIGEQENPNYYSWEANEDQNDATQDLEDNNRNHELDHNSENIEPAQSTGLRRLTDASGRLLGAQLVPSGPGVRSNPPPATTTN
jgi:hypothetical protein